MATLLAVYNSDGCVGRCDAKCYNATGTVCDCLCGGVNHGVGRQKAEANTAQMAGKLLERWQAEHPDTQRMEANTQMALFEE